MTYSTDDNVYFNYIQGTSTFLDSMNFTFAYSEANVKDTFFNLPIAVTGAPAAVDRPINITIDPASTALQGTHYDLPQFVMRAGKVQDTLRIRLKRAADLQTSKKYLIFNLHASELFKTDILYKIGNGSNLDTCHLLRFQLSTSDILAAGQYWQWYYDVYFGEFTAKKVLMLHNMLGMPLDFWSTNEMTNAKITAAQYYAATMGRYLTEEAAQGRTVYEDDGVTPMRMADAYQ